MWFAWVGSLSGGKLFDDLSPAQFDSLVKVLSLSSTKRDFRHLLTPSNIREVFDYSEEFILLKVLRLNFKGLGGRSSKREGSEHPSYLN